MDPKSICDDIFAFYQSKYKVDECGGSTFIPEDFVTFYNDNNVSDNWDHQIACVLCDKKPVCMTDYDSNINPEELQYYYEKTPKDIELRESALKCGVILLKDDLGTNFWFKEKYRRNVELLLSHFNGKETFPTELSETIRSIVLGYSPIAIICYQLFQQMIPILYQQIPNFNPSNTMLDDILVDSLQGLYKTNILHFVNYYLPLILRAQRWIVERGGSI
jgi:hypothetical protein